MEIIMHVAHRHLLQTLIGILVDDILVNFY